MKSILKRVFVNFLCFLAVSGAIPAIDYSGKLLILITASVVLSVVNWLVKPILNLLFLPLNFITLGTFRWITNILLIYLVTIITPEFKITPFLFPGINFQGFIIPPIYFNLFFTYLLVAFLLSIISDIIYSVFK